MTCVHTLVETKSTQKTTPTASRPALPATAWPMSGQSMASPPRAASGTSSAA
eukprot:CAMPEP_0198578160 /NCGR_PEP_ID=MMETSP1462-20131121/119838_1 /TAXON_ID=1333877 /ORGANISM="Brandtodinium nutriculum, Strain RCC3387" /LENGTH=51 /DNA_ID=CAMNT_0044309453 /DNA_START=9 /DNA_END=161 /DNA_ORIENTATION=-